jgi:hypothetical protein
MKGKEVKGMSNDDPAGSNSDGPHLAEDDNLLGRSYLPFISRKSVCVIALNWNMFSI